MLQNSMAKKLLRLSLYNKSSSLVTHMPYNYRLLLTQQKKSKFQWNQQVRCFATAAQIKKPTTCFYKILNVSARATPEEIKASYYELAKKYHPDTIAEEDKDHVKDKFKEITEAYSILGDAGQREKYDRLIFGDSASSDFQNQDAYDYWKERDPEGYKKGGQLTNSNKTESMRDLKNAKSYEEFFDRYEHHRDKNQARENLMRGEGFQELNKKYGTKYDYYEDANEEHQDKYIRYRERFYENYWDTKDNAAYYSQSASTRAWLTLKKVMSFYWDIAIIWGAFALVFVVYSARTNSSKTNVSHAYLQIFKSKSLEPLEYVQGHSYYDNKYTKEDFANPNTNPQTQESDNNKKESK